MAPAPCPRLPSPCRPLLALFLSPHAPPRLLADEGPLKPPSPAAVRQRRPGPGPPRAGGEGGGMARRPLPGEGVAAGRPRRRRRPPGAQALAAGALLHAGRQGGPPGRPAVCQPSGGCQARREAAMLARRAARGGRAEAGRREGAGSAGCGERSGEGRTSSGSLFLSPRSRQPGRGALCGSPSPHRDEGRGGCPAA